MTTSRRSFLIQSATALSALAASNLAHAAGPAPVTESDPMAQSLGYKDDATKVDKSKFPQYQAGRVCAGCALYSGKASDPRGPCAAFSGKTVSAKGWCSAWTQKG